MESSRTFEWFMVLTYALFKFTSVSRFAFFCKSDADGDCARTAFAKSHKHAMESLAYILRLTNAEQSEELIERHLLDPWNKSRVCYRFSLPRKLLEVSNESDDSSKDPFEGLFPNKENQQEIHVSKKLSHRMCSKYEPAGASQDDKENHGLESVFRSTVGALSMNSLDFPSGDIFENSQLPLSPTLCRGHLGSDIVDSDNNQSLRGR